MHNQIIFLAQFEINKHLLIYQRPQIALALRPLAILLFFKKIYSWLFILNCARNHVITYAIISIYRADGSETMGLFQQLPQNDTILPNALKTFLILSSHTTMPVQRNSVMTQLFPRSV